MWHIADPASAENSAGPRCPAVGVLVLACAGVVVAPFASAAGWWAMATATWAALFVLGRHNLMVRMGLPLCLVATMAAWSRTFLSSANDSDIAHWVTPERRLVCLEGVVTEPAVTRTRKGWLGREVADDERSSFVLRCSQLCSHHSVERLSGSLIVYVAGRREPLVGDRLEILGWLQGPAPLRNPGDERLGPQRPSLFVEHPALVKPQGTSTEIFDRLWAARAIVRRAIQHQWYAVLPADLAALSVSLLLGGREALSPDWLDAFRGSGLMHVLAISGLNVGLVAGLTIAVTRRFTRRRRWLMFAPLAVLALWLMVVEVNPPIVRAASMSLWLLIARNFRRHMPIAQSLSLAALAVMIPDPHVFLSAGAQLSFLCVVAIVLASRTVRQFQHLRKEAQREQETSAAWNAVRNTIEEAIVVTTAVWLLTAPLAWYRFQAITPVGWLATLLLGPFTLLLLLFGYALLAVIWLPAVLFGWLVLPWRWGIEGLVTAADFFAGVPGGSWGLPAPPVWWIIGLYVAPLAGWAIGQGVAGQMLARLGRAATGHAWSCWLLVGSAGWLFAPPTTDLRVIFIDVGHGGAILVLDPDGKTALFDAGGLGDGARTARTIVKVLRNQGRSRIDVLLISHPDADHCSAVPELLHQVPVGWIGGPPRFWRETSSLMQEIHAAINRSGRAQRVVAAPATIPLGRTQLSVWHPAADFQSRWDNAHSLTIAVDFTGRRLLLTGDVERDGFVALSQQAPGTIDVLQSPHHGAQGSNPPTLAEWAQPQHVVACSGPTFRPAKLEQRYANATVWSTTQHGAVTVVITPAGELRMHAIRPSTAKPHALIE